MSKQIHSYKERRRLKALAKSLVPPGVGLIVRTVAEGKNAKTLDTDLRLLLDKWRKMEQKLAGRPNPPMLIHRDVNMLSSVMRDRFSEDYDRVLIDNERLYRNVRNYIQAIAPQMADAIRYHNGKEHVFEAVGIHAEIQEAFEELAPVSRMDVSSVSGVVAADTVRNAFIAVVVAAIAILLYITWAFRQVPNPFRYGVAAIIALVHDVLIVLGIFSILGKVINLEVNAMFITGLLTIIGYSVNDTIVVFDRIRENVVRLPAERLEKNVNTSLLETLGRSMNTSVTLLITVLALLLLGGETIRNFLLVLLIGLISGTYSSIAIASQVLVSWEVGEIGRTMRRFRLLPARSRA